MTSLTEKKIITKMFFGCVITTELRLHLEKSHLWKNYKLCSKTENSADLHFTETHHDERCFFGIFIKNNTTTTEELRAFENQIKNKLNEFCSNFNTNALKCSVFSQIFLP